MEDSHDNDNWVLVDPVDLAQEATVLNKDADTDSDGISVISESSQYHESNTDDEPCLDEETTGEEEDHQSNTTAPGVDDVESTMETWIYMDSKSQMDMDSSNQFYLNCFQEPVQELSENELGCLQSDVESDRMSITTESDSLKNVTDLEKFHDESHPELIVTVKRCINNSIIMGLVILITSAFVGQFFVEPIEEEPQLFTDFSTDVDENLPYDGIPSNILDYCFEQHKDDIDYKEINIEKCVELQSKHNDMNMKEEMLNQKEMYLTMKQQYLDVRERELQDKQNELLQTEQRILEAPKVFRKKKNNSIKQHKKDSNKKHAKFSVEQEFKRKHGNAGMAELKIKKKFSWKKSDTVKHFKKGKKGKNTNEQMNKRTKNGKVDKNNIFKENNDAKLKIGKPKAVFKDGIKQVYSYYEKKSTGQRDKKIGNDHEKRKNRIERKDKNSENLTKYNKKDMQWLKKYNMRKRSYNHLNFTRNYIPLVMREGKGNKTFTGSWYFNLHKARNEIRTKEHEADWYFDRVQLRKYKRDKAKWYFNWMSDREKVRVYTYDK